MLGEAAADGTGLLGAEVEGEQLLLLVRLPQRGLLLLRDHRQHARDRGAHHLAAKPKRTGFNSIHCHPTSREWRDKPSREKAREKVDCWYYAHLGELVGGSAGDLGHAEEGELGLELLELRLQLRLVLHPELVHLDPGCNSSPQNGSGVRSAGRRGSITPTMGALMAGAYPWRRWRLRRRSGGGVGWSGARREEDGWRRARNIYNRGRGEWDGTLVVDRKP